MAVFRKLLSPRGNDMAVFRKLLSPIGNVMAVFRKLLSLSYPKLTDMPTSRNLTLIN
jgi:hypothetical protein